VRTRLQNIFLIILLYLCSLQDLLAQSSSSSNKVNTYQKFDSLLTQTLRFGGSLGDFLLADLDTCHECEVCRHFIHRNSNGAEFINKDYRGKTGYRQLFHAGLARSCFPFHLNTSLIEYFFSNPDTIIDFNDVVDEERYYTVSIVDECGNFCGLEWIGISKLKSNGKVTRAWPKHIEGCGSCNKAEIVQAIQKSKPFVQNFICKYLKSCFDFMEQYHKMPEGVDTFHAVNDLLVRSSVAGAYIKGLPEIGGGTTIPIYFSPDLDMFQLLRDTVDFDLIDTLSLLPSDCTFNNRIKLGSYIVEKANKNLTRANVYLKSIFVKNNYLIFTLQHQNDGLGVEFYFSVNYDADTVPALRIVKVHYSN
jgi:hypothetical protein